MSIQSPSPKGKPQPPARFFRQPLYLRCVGSPRFRGQLSKDIACLLKLDSSVSAWSCQSLKFQCGTGAYYPDFAVERSDDVLVIDALAHPAPPIWIADAVRTEGYAYQTMSRGDIDPIRLQNCKDLLQYSGAETRLGDRIRLLAALEEQSTLKVSECLPLLQEGRPIYTLANMILARFIEIDLDTALIGPETTVRKFTS